MGSSATRKRGSGGQRPRDADALPLPARELVRVAAFGARVEAHQGQELARPIPTLGGRAQAVNLQGFLQRARPPSAGGPGTRTGPGRSSACAAGPCRSSAGVRSSEVASLKVDFARGGLHEVKERPARRGLPAAALSHEAQGLAFADFEAHSVHRVDAPRVPPPHPAPQRIVSGALAPPRAARSRPLHQPAGGASPGARRPGRRMLPVTTLHHVGTARRERARRKSSRRSGGEPGNRVSRSTRPASKCGRARSRPRV